MNLILAYFSWHFFDFPKQILRAIFNFLRFGMRYFSIPFLLKTFFSHWHKYSWSYPRGFQPSLYLQVWFSNLISRIVGALARSFLIFSGIFFEIFILIFGGIFLIFWYLLPLISIWLFLYGLKLFF